MLYDPKWEQKTETKTDPMTTAALIAWMEKEKTEARYCFADNGDCLIAKYISHVVGVKVTTGYSTWNDGAGQIGTIPEGWVWDIAKPKPHTYGAAIKRARALASAV
jgi:hypothetical protein